MFEGIFADRRDAGLRLGAALADDDVVDPAETVVLGVPRGGVEVAAAVADTLGAMLDVVIPRKLGAPQNPELGIGAVAEGVEVLDERLIATLRVPEEYLRREIEAQQAEILRRTEAYRQGRAPAELEGRVAVVVDDGVATGGTAVAALRSVRARGAARVVLAVPVAPPQAVARLRREADEVRTLATPEPFFAVGQWYRDFPQTPDERVVELLTRHAG